MAIFKGSGVAIVTPFNEDASIDFRTLEELINLQIKNNTDAIIICGTTGEASTLTDDEQIQIIKFAVEVTKNRVPVIAGTGSNYTEHCIKLSKESQKVGADALLIVTPYYNKTTQRGIVKYYESISNNVDLPIIMYNIPSRTGLNIAPETVQYLSKIKNIVGVKEASGNISQVAKVCLNINKDFNVYAGNDDQVLPILALGGIGVISALANIIPNDVHNMVIKFLEGDFITSRNIQLSSLNLCNNLFSEVNPVPVKTALDLMGICKAVFRQPLINMEEKNLQNLKKAMLDYGIKIN